MRISDWSSDVCSSDLSDDYAWLQRDVLGDEASRRLPRARAFTALAAELGVGPAPLAIAWCLRNPHVSSVILGASRVAQLLQNLEALDIAVRVDEGGRARVEAAMGEGCFRGIRKSPLARQRRRLSINRKSGAEVK